MNKIYGLWKKSSFESRFKDYSVLAVEDLFIKVNCFKLQVSICQSDRINLLNIFEETILKFALINIYDPEIIAENLCLDVDLVKLIQLKMRRKNFLNYDNKPNFRGEKYFSTIEEENKTTLEDFICLLPLVEAHFPYINSQDYVYDYPYSYVEEFDNYNILTCKLGSAGDSKDINGFVIEDINPSFECIERPNDTEIRNLIRNNKNLSKLILDKSTPINIPIRGEEAYFHYKIAILSDSVIVSDGYHINDGVLSDLIKTRYPYIVDNLYKMANISNNTPAKVTPPKITKLSDLLCPPLEFSEKHSRKNLARENNKLLSDYYSAIEWAFFYNLQKNPVRSYLVDLCYSNDYTENSNYIQTTYQSIFGSSIEDYSNLFNFSRDNITRYKNENSKELNLLLPFMILQAKEDDYSLFHKLISAKPDFIKFISKLKSLRDSILHSSDRQISFEEIYDFYNQTVYIVTIILPHIKIDHNFKFNDNHHTSQSKETINYTNLLSKELGVEVYHKLDELTQSKLLEIVKIYKSNSPYNFINSIYSLLQKSLVDYIKNYNNVCSTTGEFSKQIAINILNQADMFNQNCPKTLYTVRAEMFEKSKVSKHSSLGGNMLVVTILAKDNPEKLIEICKFVDRILSLRAHGNDIGLILDVTQMKDIFTNLIKFIKIIGEI